jgi:adenine/guanine phosphoribosyltransferase-like PRPP-binding protein
MLPANTNDDAITLALTALGWTLADQPRAERLIALTGLTPADLRSRADDRTMLAAVIGFLEAHEPDLIACAEALGIAPARLVAVRGELER